MSTGVAPQPAGQPDHNRAAPYAALWKPQRAARQGHRQEFDIPHVDVKQSCLPCSSAVSLGRCDALAGTDAGM
jgi:hypothetical protein